MKKFLILLMLLPAISTMGSNTDTIVISSEITDVTVFFSGAQVTRTAKLNLPKGQHLLKFDQLPFEINSQSIQVKGLSGCDILSVKHQVSYRNTSIKDQDEKNTQKLIDAMEFNINDLKNRLSVFDMEMQLLSSNSNLQKKDDGSAIGDIKEAADYYRTRLNEILQSKLKLDRELKDAGDSLQALYAQLNEVNSRKRLAFSQILVLVDCSQSINDALCLNYYIASAGWTPLYDFRVDDITEPLTIVYNANVYQSSSEDWKNVRVKLSTNNPSMTGDKPELVKWDILQGDPNQKASLGGGAGCIRGRVLDLNSQEPMPFANVVVKVGGQMVAASTTDMNGMYVVKPVPLGYCLIEISYVGYELFSAGSYVTGAADVIQDASLAPQVIALQEVMIMNAKVENTEIMSDMIYDVDGSRQIQQIPSVSSGVVYQRGRGDYMGVAGKVVDGVVVDKRNAVNLISNSIKMNLSNLEYVIDAPYTIPSDGQDYLIKIRDTNIAVNYVYQAVPKMDQDAFLTAEVIAWTPLNLLSGKTSIYYQGTFTGESYIDANNTSDTLSISLGRDKNILVTRTGNKETFDKRVIGSTIRETVGYDILVKNNKKAPIRIFVEDQYPTSERKSVEVELLEFSGAKNDVKEGKLTWEILLQPGEKKQLVYKYSVKYPKDEWILIQ